MITSEYYQSWEDYKKDHPELEDKPWEIIGPKLEKYEDQLFQFVFNLLL